MIVFCNAELLISATVLRQCLSTALSYLFIFRTMKMISGELHNMDWCWVISIASCVCCKCVSINCKMRQLASCGVANMLKVLATFWEETSMPMKLMRAQGGPLLREASTDFLYFHTFSQLCILVIVWWITEMHKHAELLSFWMLVCIPYLLKLSLMWMLTSLWTFTI